MSSVSDSSPGSRPDADAGAVAIAVAQFLPGADSAANLDRIRVLANEAAARGARLIVFPEYSSFFTPQLGPQSIAAAESLDGPFATGLAHLAAELGVYIVAGMLEETMGGERCYNAVLALGPTGERLAVYRKIHLYDAFGQKESDWVVAGDIAQVETFTVDGLRVALQTCYDLRFPEVTRRLADAGAEIVACPSQWVRGPLKEHHWRTFVTARALENTLYFAAADHAAPSGVGLSMIVDPMGVELAAIGEEQGVTLAWVTKKRIDDVRSVNPALELRRFGVHER